MTLLSGREAIGRRMPAMPPVTPATKQVIWRNRTRMRGSMRMATARVWETQKYEDWRRRVLHAPL